MKKQPYKITERDIEDYIPDASNANLGSERGASMIEDSLSQDGAGRSLVADKDGRLVAGNKTQDAAVNAGITKVIEIETDGDAIIVHKRRDFDLSDPEGAARRYAYRDNRAGELSLTWSPEQLQLDIDAGVDLSRMFSETELLELGAISDDDVPEDPGADMSRADELQEKWAVTLGDLYKVGEHRVLCGDSTKAEDVKRLMGDEIPNLVLTSPPYPGAEMWNDDGSDKFIVIDKLNKLNRQLLETAWDILPDGGVCLWNVADVPFGNHGMITTTTTTTTIACKEIGFIPRGQIIWNKISPNLTPPSFMRRPCIPSLAHEFIFLFFKGDWKPREKKCGIPQDYKRWMALNVWDISPESAKAIGHKAPFPLELPIRCLNLWSLDNDIVVDLCLGSGTTLVACEQLNRRGYGAELHPPYVAVVLERLTGLGLEVSKL
jgi:site-specific DNA-methyltransferase (adenine-specific)